MRSVKVREVVIGEGMPKICVPIVEKNDKAIVSTLKQVVLQKPDMVEFRADVYEHLKDRDSLLKVLETIRKLLGNLVLLFTIRTDNEGGNVSLGVEEYEAICKCACESGYIDLVDVEAFIQNGVLEKLCNIAHDNGVYVVGSNHDFEKTPDKEEIVRRLNEIRDRGADIAKIAVMPNCEEDVISLLAATLRISKEADAGPVITMSMGKTGQISRISGEIFGSAVTFATVGNESAPGQISIDKVKKVIEILHIASL